jgi:hypothetical protein
MSPPVLSPAAARADRIFFRWVFPALLVVVFLVYATFRQRYIGATDWYGYYQQGELLKTGRVFLPTELPVDQYPAIVPFGYVVMGSHAVPQYTPGFPLLLALGSFAGLTFFVTPLIGVLSCLLMFWLVRDLTDRRIAAVFTLAWAFFPIVVFGSTTLMSDLVAATAVMGAYLAYRRGQLLLSAWVLGFSFCVRPTNVLFLAVFLLPLARDRRLIRYGLYLLGPVLLYSFYNYTIYGSPLRTGYADIRTDLTREVFSQHFGFYLWYTLAQFTPVLIALALWGLRPFNREKLFHVLWFAVFLVFYSFWLSGGDRWWWTRFLLPGYPAIFLLAASGFARLRDRWHAPASAAHRPDWRVVLLFAAVAVLPVWQVHFGRSQQDLWERNKGHGYHDIVERVAALVPAHSLVGSVEFGGSFNIYTPLTGFVSVFDTTPALILEGFRQKREVYLLVEPWNLNHSNILGLLQRFPAEKIAEISEPGWGKLPLYRLRPPQSPAPPAGH